MLEISSGPTLTEKNRLYDRAATLAVITIVYNIIEGIVCVWFGLDDDTLSLFGFGLDSFVEVISGMGVWHMIRRQRRDLSVCPDAFEKTALRITGGAFYLLTAGLVLSALFNLYQGHRPETTLWGIVIAVISIAAMAMLIHFKVKVGKALRSEAILADAACSRVCMLLSLILLAASAGYELTGMGGIDALGALGIAYLSFREGREAMMEAAGLVCTCGERLSLGK